MNTQINDRPYIVGHYWNGRKSDFLALSTDEIARAEWFYRRIVDNFNIPARSVVLLISRYEDGAFTAPLEQALTADGYIAAYAEATTFDAVRVEAFMRRFDIPAVLGVTIDTLNGLESAGFSAAEVFAGSIVWARDKAAYLKLAKVPGITLRFWTEVGPAAAMECIEGGGLHVDSLEWALDTAADGEILVTSRLGRIVPFERMTTGIYGHIDHSACACGSGDPRVSIERIREQMD